jgi:hypothetical protein
VRRGELGTVSYRLLGESTVADGAPGTMALALSKLAAHIIRSR